MDRRRIYYMCIYIYIYKCQKSQQNKMRMNKNLDNISSVHVQHGMLETRTATYLQHMYICTLGTPKEPEAKMQIMAQKCVNIFICRLLVTVLSTDRQDPNT